MGVGDLRVAAVRAPPERLRTVPPGCREVPQLRAEANCGWHFSSAHAEASSGQSAVFGPLTISETAALKSLIEMRRKFIASRSPWVHGERSTRRAKSESSTTLNVSIPRFSSCMPGEATVRHQHGSDTTQRTEFS